MTTALHRERLADVRQRTAEARDWIARAKRDREAAVHEWDGRDPNAAAARRAHLATQELNAAQRDLDFARDEESALLHQVAGLSGSHHPTSFLTDANTIGHLESLADSSMPIGSVNLGEAMSPDQLVATIEAGDWGR